MPGQTTLGYPVLATMSHDSKENDDGQRKAWHSLHRVESEFGWTFLREALRVTDGLRYKADLSARDWR